MTTAILEFHTVRKIPAASDLVAAWMLDCWGDTKGEGEETLRQRLAGRLGDPEAIVATLHGHPVGAVAFHNHPLAPENQEALWIDAVYVLPEHRNRGIASRLIAVAERAAAREQAHLYAFTVGGSLSTPYRSGAAADRRRA